MIHNVKNEGFRALNFANEEKVLLLHYILAVVRQYFSSYKKDHDKRKMDWSHRSIFYGTDIWIEHTDCKKLNA